tara:strand:+ start:5592 stop:6275 length:684 start_codon:yes stop_codon:yes gene_type:complete
VTEYLYHILTIARKDLRGEFRSKEVLNAATAFTLVVLLVFSFSFDPIVNPDVRNLAGGLLWVVYLFASVLILTRSFAREITNGCLDALIASPVPASAIFCGKLLSNALLLLLIELVSLPVFSVFYDISWLGKFDSLLPVLLLGTWSITAVGTIFSAITAGNRLRELMLPLLVFPMTLPVLMACVKVTTLIFTGEPLGESIVWLKLLIAFAVIFTLLGAVLLEAVLLA